MLLCYLELNIFIQKKEYNKINFHLLLVLKLKYSKWIEGYRISIQGKGAYVKKANPSNTYKDFKKLYEYSFFHIVELFH